MNDPWMVSTATVISLLATALAGIAVFFAKRFVDKLERLDAEAVRKRELKELEERIAEDQKKQAESQRDMHEQNRAFLSEIKEDIRGIYGMLNRRGQ